MIRRHFVSKALMGPPKTVATAKRPFATTAPPIDIGPVVDVQSTEAVAVAGGAATAATSNSRVDSSPGTSLAHQKTSNSLATDGGKREEPLNVTAARLAIARKPTDPYLPNAQKELPSYVARSSDLATAHYSAMTAEEALAFHAQQSPLGTHRGALGVAGLGLGGGAGDATSLAAAVDLGGSNVLGSTLGVSSDPGYDHSLQKPLYEWPGVRRDLIMQRREERKISYRQVQLGEATEAIQQESEAGREAFLVAKSGGKGKEMLPSSARLVAVGEDSADVTGTATKDRLNAAHLAPGRSTHAELREQAILNTMREEDIDRVNRHTMNDPSTLSAPAEEQRFREMLSASGRFFMAEDKRAKRDVFGGDFAEGQFKFKTSLGVPTDGDDDTMPMFQIDPQARKRLVAERKDAVLGVGPLAKLEQKKKARIAEIEYEMSLLPEERTVYREERRKVMTELKELEAEAKTSEYALLEGEGDPTMSATRQSKLDPKEDPALLSSVRANTQYPILREKPKLFQMRVVGQDLEESLVSYDPVPNNTPTPKAPMWTSSLSVPVRGRKFKEDNWRNPQLSRGLVPDDKIEKLEAFLKDACPKLAEDKVLEKNITVKPRAMYTKGLYAKRRFRKGEIIATIPIPRTWAAVTNTNTSDKAASAAQTESPLATSSAAEQSSSTTSSSSSSSSSGVGEGVWKDPRAVGSSASSSWKMSLTMESLLAHSAAVRDRNVPSYESLHYMLAKPTTSLGVAAHPLFTEQMYLACLIACEKDLGSDSQFAAYFDAVADPCVDDDYIKELHREAVEPHSFYEYDDHLRRYDDAIRRIQKKWPDAPHFDTIRWAVRFVLSRQRMVPVRVRGLDADDLNDVWDSKNDDRDLDWFARMVRRTREFIYRKTIPRAMVESAERVAFDTDKAVMPSVIPLVDMLHHDNKGVGTVVMEHCKAGQVVDRSPSYGSEADGHSLAPPATSSEGHNVTSTSVELPKAMDNHDDVSIVLRANHDLEEGEELTVVYPKCYSVSFTLYKYGFLAYRPASHDASMYFKQHGAGDLSQERLARSAVYEDEDYPDAVGDEVDFAEMRRSADTTYAQDVGAAPITAAPSAASKV